MAGEAARLGPVHTWSRDDRHSTAACALTCSKRSTMERDVEATRQALSRTMDIAEDKVESRISEFGYKPNSDDPLPSNTSKQEKAPSVSVPIHDTPTEAKPEPTMRVPHNRVQLIDEAQQFHGRVFQTQMKEWGLTDVGFGYDICAVLGSQSTGKSTLLNRLFGTNFDVMNERSRQQTTKGIWLSRGMDRNILVMDVEGTDGRERGEDQDFERKSALFSLSTAECLIVNMWENQVGLYQGANMGLLKTVLDVNLSLFQASRARAGVKGEKTLLLFVIRDYIGTTPLSNLEATVLGDLDRIWSSLQKPDSLPNAQLCEFFDISFAALPHKILQAREFDSGIEALQRRFVDRNDPNYVFQTQYHKRIPIDGLPHYLEGVWEQVMQNKDLDLPTQQELLAQFRCDEIAAAAVAAFGAAVKVLRAGLDAGRVLPTLGQDMAAYRTQAIAAFDKDASRYHQGVYARKRSGLLGTLNGTLLPFLLTQLKNVHEELTVQFKKRVEDAMRAPYDFGALVAAEHTRALEAYDEATKPLVLSETDWNIEDERARFDEALQAMAVSLRAQESRKLEAQIERDMRRQLSEPVELALAAPGPEMWDTVLRAYAQVVDQGVSVFRERSAALNCSPEEEAAGTKALQRAAWRRLLDKVREQTSDAVLAMRLRTFFEDRFRYDSEGIPRVWKPTDDMDSVFVKARDAALELIPMYAYLAPADNELLAAHVAIVGEGDDDTPPLEEARRVLSELQRTELANRVRRAADAAYIEAKRGTVSSMAQVPLWVYVALVVLGWNEGMAVLRSPVYFTLLCMVLAGVYVTWRLNLTTPLLTAASALMREVRAVAEEQLRSYLAMPPLEARAGPHLAGESEKRPAVPNENAMATEDEKNEPRLPASF